MKSRAKTAKAPPAAMKPARPKKVRATFHISEQLFEAVRDAVVACTNPTHYLTLASFAEDALREKLERLQIEKNKGKPFPRRTRQLLGGRPIGT